VTESKSAHEVKCFWIIFTPPFLAVHALAGWLSECDGMVGRFFGHRRTKNRPAPLATVDSAKLWCLWFSVAKREICFMTADWQIRSDGGWMLEV